MRIETLAIHAARKPDPATGAISGTLHLASTFERAADGSYPHGHFYGRASNPGRQELEQAIATLEGGAQGVAFSSGTAATLAVFGLLRAGDHVIAPAECYHGTIKQLHELIAPRGVEVTLAETWTPAAVAAAWRSNTRLLWIETPSNPRLHLTDIAAAAEFAHTRKALLACDSTFAPPVIQRPLALGADFVMHSTTKYFGGHSDVTGGIVVAAQTGDALDGLRHQQLQGGAVPSPFDCWLLRRSMMTLPLRVEAQCDNAERVAAFLAAHPVVERVYYPGLASHPGHDVARRQMRRFGAMMSVQVHGGEAAALAVAARVKVFTRATSLGGVESLIEHRASMEGPGTKTPQNLLRLSIGIENADDLLEDLAQALG